MVLLALLLFRMVPDGDCPLGGVPALTAEL
jgi:hypothetical protein